MAFRLKPLDAVTLDKKRDPRPALPTGKDKDYLAWLHQLSCCVTGVTSGLIAHHLTVNRNRMACKADDRLALPLVGTMHDQHPGALHVVGERNFWTRWAINPFMLCDDLSELYDQLGPNVVSGNRIIRAHRQLAQARIEAGVKVFSVRTRNGEAK